jgi:glycosidase
MRDSRGEVTGVYTHALDIANEDWQDHFVAGCERIVREYGIDGFRFDAPFYNRFANWSETTRRHASYSSLGALELLRKLRRRLRSISDEVLLHSEPSGPFVRESLDLCYCYEERWLVASLFGRDHATAHEWRRVRSGRELGAWFREFDAALPVGSVSAHFIDCHDTIWWRLPGDLWRREQVGLEATRALVAIYGLRGGGYMTVVGGEEGVEDELRLVHALRRLPEIRDGSVDYEAVSAADDAVYTVLRRDGERCAVVAVNTSGTPLYGRSTVEVRAAVGPSGADRAFDAWNDEWLPYEVGGDGIARLELEFAPYQARVILFADPPADLL